MSESTSSATSDKVMSSVLLWDLAGTLHVHDPITHRSGPLPGCEDSFPILARDFRMVVATGEESGSARRLLGDYGLLPFFEEIFGGLLSYGGKPHGEILRQLNGKPEHSLVIGDRLGADIPADSENLVTILINQDGDTNSADLVADTIGLMCESGSTMPEAFKEIAQRAKPDSESIGPRNNGMVTTAWRSDELFGARLLVFEPDWADSRRNVIVF